MSYLNFDKTLLMNLEKSISKEMIRTNRAGTYNFTTLIDCNTRKYHGQLVMPLPDIDNSNHVLLSSLDETVIQHGAEFNLGVHRYEGNNYFPNGHKYIREFDCELISRTIYRVGGVILSKERMLVSFEPRILIKYTLLEAHSPTLLRFKPFLAFRSVNELTLQNNIANTSYSELQNGISMKMYTTQPGIQLYTGNFLQDCPSPGKGGVPLEKYGGFALETQHFPCSPSHPEFPTTVLRAGKVFRANTTLRFFTGRQCGRL